MTTVEILENIKKFLEDNVCNCMKLQKPDDMDVDKYELTNPAAHIGWIPPKGFLPSELNTMIPCLVVGMDEGSDDGQEGKLPIRISVVVYSPGFHGGVEYIPNFQGYNDLVNLIDRTVAEIAKHQILNGIAIEYPIKWGMYQDPPPYPYWYGWVSFLAVKLTYPKALIEL